MRTAVGLESRCDYAEPPTGQQPNRHVFLAHFPELEAPLREWDEAVEQVRMAPGALWEWFATAAAERGIDEPTFAVGPLIDRLAILTLQRARNWQLDNPRDLRLEYFTDRVGDDEYVSIHLERQKVAQLPRQPHDGAHQPPEEAGRLMQELFDDAQSSAQAQAVIDTRESLLILKDELLENLTPRPSDTPTLLADGCPGCRRALAPGG